MTAEGESSTTYIWFDDRDYLMRKTTTQSPDGSTSEFTFSYDKASVSEPSPVKETPPTPDLNTLVPTLPTETIDITYPVTEE